MSAINEGRADVVGVRQWTIHTKSGNVTQFYDAENDVYTWFVDTLGFMFPHELGATDRTVC